MAPLFRLLLLAALLFGSASAWARSPHEQARIDYLLHDVEEAKGIQFIRNGSAHDGPAAAKHLRMKLDYAGERIQTAEQFVKFLASESSLTHRKYQVRLADGKTEDAAEYFAARLRLFDSKKSE